MYSRYLSLSIPCVRVRRSVDDLASRIRIDMTDAHPLWYLINILRNLCLCKENLPDASYKDFQRCPMPEGLGPT